MTYNQKATQHILLSLLTLSKRGTSIHAKKENRRSKSTMKHSEINVEVEGVVDERRSICLREDWIDGQA